MGEPKMLEKAYKNFKKSKKTTQKYDMKHGPQKHKKEPNSLKIEARLAPGGGGREPFWSPKLSRAENRRKNECPRLPQTPPKSDPKMAKS